MASPQCSLPSAIVTQVLDSTVLCLIEPSISLGSPQRMCLPPLEDVVAQVLALVEETGVLDVFVGSDDRAAVATLTAALNANRPKSSRYAVE